MKIYLNLLPEDRKEQIYRAKRFKLLLKQGLLLLIPLFIFCGMLFFTLYLVDMQLENTILNNAKNDKQSAYRELDEYEKIIRDFNGDVQKIKGVSDKHLQWSEYLSIMASLTPDGVSINDISTKDYQVFLVGKADKRESMMNFKESLEKNDCFESVNVPLSSLVSKENIEFQIDVILKRECLLVTQK